MSPRGTRNGTAAQRNLWRAEIADDGELIVEFTVPENSVALEFTLRGKIEGLISGKKIDLVTKTAMEINASTSARTPKRSI